MAAKPIPEGYHTLTPSITVREAARAVEFYKQAFGAVEKGVMKGPDGKVMHAELRIGDSILMLADEFPQFGSLSDVYKRQPRVYSFDFLRDCVKPKLFVSGACDQFGPRAKLEALVASVPEPKKLVMIEGADHFFEGRLRELREAIEGWVKELLSEQPPAINSGSPL